ncbi:capsule biosynthesis GfcC family protein, partial [Gammaproteobacteria bacterium]|nr:capsule biosynthesis GfcC family protein [Gammaproteobacteria bacterium]
GGGRSQRHVDINLENGRDFQLSPFDQLVIRQMPNWTDNETVTLRGEVNSPGTYSITKEDTVSSLIARAGGLTDFADPRAAVFLREALRQNEARVLEEYSQQLQEDAAAQQLQDGDLNASVAETQQLLDTVTSAEATGRLVIDLPRILAGRGAGIDPELRDGDELLIPRTAQEVTVLGEIRQPTSHLFDEVLTVADYIGRSGGYTEDALTRGVYVIRASGEVVPFGGARWFFQARSRVEPGDSIVVPFEPERPDQLTIWTSVSQILFNISTTLLAIERVGN